MPKLKDIEVVADRTEGSRPDEGFLRVRRLVVRNRYDDGTTSDEYPCDVVRRPSADAVAIALHERVGARVMVVLKEGPRVPVYLRREQPLTIPDPRPYLTVAEMAAGLIEPEDGGPGGLEKRAALEAEEEVGYPVPGDRVSRLGEGSFASPGTTDEKVYFASADVTGLVPGEATGDGSVMEEAGEVLVLDLVEAIRQCRSGEIPDLKTEVGLLRLADRIGYLPQLGRFVDDLPEDLRAAFDPLGVS